MKADSLNFELDKANVSEALKKVGVESNEQQLNKLEQLIQLLMKWNKVYNLTAIRDPKKMVIHHLLDSLAILPYLDGKSVLDVGSGAGIPGIPLAIFRSDIEFTLLDSNRKKTRFIAQAAIELGLKNVSVETARVEVCQFPTSFDVIVTRAFASVDKILSLTAKHCAEEGELLLMKGLIPEQELADLSEGFSVKEIVSLDVPELDAERHLVILSRR